MRACINTESTTRNTTSTIQAQKAQKVMKAMDTGMATGMKNKGVTTVIKMMRVDIAMGVTDQGITIIVLTVVPSTKSIVLGRASCHWINVLHLGDLNCKTIVRIT